VCEKRDVHTEFCSFLGVLRSEPGPKDLQRTIFE